MRGQDAQQAALFSYLSPEDGCQRTARMLASRFPHPAADSA